MISPVSLSGCWTVSTRRSQMTESVTGQDTSLQPPAEHNGPEASALPWRCRRSSRRLSRHENPVARIARSVRTLEARVELLDFESAAGRQVFHLEPKQMPHREGVNRPLFATIRVGHVVDELDLIHLIESIVRDDLQSPEHARPSVVEKSRLVADLRHRRTAEIVESGIEEVENQSSTVDQMSSNILETQHLFFPRNRCWNGETAMSRGRTVGPGRSHAYPPRSARSSDSTCGLSC